MTVEEQVKTNAAAYNTFDGKTLDVLADSVAIKTILLFQLEVLNEYVGER